MANRRTSLYYMKLCKKTLHEIYMTPPDQGKRFLMLKAKAEKYLALAKKLEAQEK